MQQKGQGVVISSGQKPIYRLDGKSLKKRLFVYTCTDLFMQYAYEKLAVALYKCTPLKYTLKGESGLSDDWLL